MAVQTIKRTRCKSKKVKEKLKAFVKQGLKFLLVRPVTWQYIMVNFPAWIEKVGSYLKDIVSFLSNLIP